MGKVKTRILGLEDVEEKQKKEQKMKAEEKKMLKRKEEPKKEEDASVKTTPTEVAKPKIKKERKGPVVVKVRGKKYTEVKKLVDKNKLYLITEAVTLVKKLKVAKFDESVELHFVVDDMGLKGEVELPFSIGKQVKVAVVDEKLLEQIEKGKLDFDVLVTHPSFMPKLAKFAKVLGPKGLMPNPKAGTISAHPEEIVKKFSKGLLRWKTEAKFPLVHQMIGKVSFEDKNLVENAKKFIDAVGKKHILKAYLKSTMSPSVKINLER